MRVVWTDGAESDRLEILDFIGRDDPIAALRIDEVFETATGSLGQHPKLGRPGRFPGTRELVPQPSYRLVYKIDGDCVWLLSLHHTARHWPSAGAELSDEP